MKKAGKYRRITWTDRLKIEALFNAHHSYQSIADELGFAKSAIHYEVKHGLYDHLDGKTWLTVKRYSAAIAQQHAKWQVTIKGAPLKLGNHYDFVEHVAKRIKAGDSPDVIVHALKRDKKWTVSTSTLYPVGLKSSPTNRLGLLCPFCPFTNVLPLFVIWGLTHICRFAHFSTPLVFRRITFQPIIQDKGR